MNDDVTPRCTCDSTHWCDVHVDCDAKCKALNEPVTLAEALHALEHWRDHGLLNGCSHGC